MKGWLSDLWIACFLGFFNQTAEDVSPITGSAGVISVTGGFLSHVVSAVGRVFPMCCL